MWSFSSDFVKLSRYFMIIVTLFYDNCHFISRKRHVKTEKFHATWSFSHFFYVKIFHVSRQRIKTKRGINSTKLLLIIHFHAFTCHRALFFPSVAAMCLCISWSPTPIGEHLSTNLSSWDLAVPGSPSISRLMSPLRVRPSGSLEETGNAKLHIASTSTDYYCRLLLLLYYYYTTTVLLLLLTCLFAFNV